MRLVGTTKSTIDQRSATAPTGTRANLQADRPGDARACSQIDLDAVVSIAAEKKAKDDAKAAGAAGRRDPEPGWRVDVMVEDEADEDSSLPLVPAAKEGRTGEPAGEDPLAAISAQAGTSGRLSPRRPRPRPSRRSRRQASAWRLRAPGRAWRRPWPSSRPPCVTSASSSSWPTRPSVTGSTGLMLVRVPVGAVAHLVDGGLGGAERLGDLGVGHLGVVAHEPGDGVGPVLPARHGGVARRPSWSA